jgi:cellulose synthase/poly-beta-1,6-N-acetylglucosamine synthase-like glycosyltransferase
MPGSWNSEIIRFGFALYNFARPLARKVLHCSAGIRGNGMCFSSDLLRRIPWNTYSLNEDLEYGLILLLGGTIVEFAPEAKVLATMPASASNARSQRSRWERGRFPVIRRYAPRLLTSGLSSFSPPLIDALIDLVIPPFVNLFGGVLILSVIHLALWAAGFLASPALAVLWGFFVLCGFVHVFAGLYAARADAMLYKAFFHIPRYAIWKLTVYLGLFRGTKSSDWVRTTRERPIESAASSDQKTNPQS